ncbi:MAG TPA: ATP-dependent Clp protease adaptor ClpS [Nitrospiraceae bacterium]|nr:ATP-dependent Clp protease adaptor ClpS [Nitrospiraceae bacterium]
MTPLLLPDTRIESREDSQIEQIPLYKIIFLNDDVTTMDFVVKILILVFKREKMTAVRLMLDVHHNGSAVVDVMPLEQAEFRQQQTHSMARKAGYPLRCIIEPA